MSKNITSREQLERLIYIDEQIREKGYLTKKEFLEHFERTDRTFQRDIEAMRLYFRAPLEYNRDRGGYFYSEDSYFLPSIFLTSREIFSLALAEEVIKQYQGTPLYDTFEKTFENLLEYIPQDQVSMDMSWMGSSRFTMFNQAQVHMDLTVWEQIFLALRECRTATLSYQKPGKPKAVERVFNPYHVVCHKGAWYVIGYDYERKTIAIYSLARLKKVYVGNKTFIIPEDFNLENYVDPELGVFMNTRQETFILKFEPPASHIVAERKWHGSQESSFDDQENLLLTIRTNQIQETLFWILSWGDKAELLEPVKYREQLADICRNMAAKYNKS